MGFNLRLPTAAAALALLALAGCGESGTPSLKRPESALTNPVVAATVNGKPIYVDDVTAEAVARGAIKEGEDLDPSSPLFYQITEDLIETRLFSMEAEARGLDKDPDVRRRLDTARERILANVLNENIANTALKDSAIERMYKEQVKLLKSGQQVRIGDILLNSKDDALAAKRRLDRGESFVALAYELSKDRVSGGEGGEVGWRTLDALPDPIRNVVANTEVGKIGGPVHTEDGWHLIKVDEKREATPPSMESMRPQIVQWLMFDEQRRIVDKLKAAAKIARLNEKPPAGVPAQAGMESPQDQPQGEQGAPGIRLGPGGQAAAGEQGVDKPQSGAPASSSPSAQAKPQGQTTPISSSPSDREM